MSRPLDRCVIGSALLLLLSSATSWAGRGDIDSNYGVSGRLRAGGLVVNLPDDQLIVAGGDPDGLHVRRFNAAGQIDRSFGHDGEVLVPVPGAPDLYFEPGVALAGPDGSFFLVGSLRNRDLTQLFEVILRLDSDGRLVTSYGGHGDGIYRLTGKSLDTSQGWIPGTVAGVAIDSSGRILLAHNEWTADGNCTGPHTIERVTPAGSRDSTFGTNGRALVPDIDLCGGVLLFGARADGSIVIGARGEIVSLDASGALDSAFGVNGRLVHVSPVRGDEMPRGRLLPDGGLLLLGSGSWSPDTHTVLTKFDRKGQLDSTFGAGSGSVQVDLGAALLVAPGLHQGLGDFALVPDSGEVYLQMSLWRDDGTAVCTAGIARISLDGTPDVHFGRQGLTCLDYGAFSFGLVAVQHSGAPLFGLWDGNLYRLLVDATPSRGMLTLVVPHSWIYVGESAGSATVTVARVAGRDSAVAARYGTGYPPFSDLLFPDGPGDGTGMATAGADYQDVSGQLDWADGDDTPRTVNVPILDDAIHENRDILGIHVTELEGGALVNGGSTNIEIDDDDPVAESSSPPTSSPPPANSSSSGTGGGGGTSSWSTLLALAGLLRARRSRQRAVRRRDERT